MKSVIVGLLLAASIVLWFADTAFAMSENFLCGTAPADICTCIGTIDCRHMRTSGMCNGPLNCDGTSCSCPIVNIVRPKPRPAGGLAGMHPTVGNGKSQQSPPVIKFKPLLPEKPMRLK